MLPERESLLPGWMLAASGPTQPVPTGSKASGKKLTGFAEKTIYSIFCLLQDALFSEQFSRKRGLLQKMDPRAKLIMGLLLLITASFVHSSLYLWTIYGVILLLALGSQIAFCFFFKRVWLFVPLYTGLVALPATLNWVIPGNPLWILHRFEQDFHFGPWSFPETLAISDNGLKAGLLFVSRVAVSVSIVVLLTLTTPWQKLLHSLRVLGVPQFFVFALGMAYRYVHLLLNLMLDLHLGKKSRMLRASSWSQDQKWVASRMSYLFKRSYNLGESVYQAMLARGFQGEAKVLEELCWRRFDTVAVAVTVTLCVTVLVLQKTG